ncbi:HotDog domain-containing protein [Podospora didyma]|uniref:HotDog domain-containing protein n=1 Tax=Podospora didyma TaxID=330526 RepID=A0AAE0N6X7_9PEZI|nr:HotDog domain-containing protein [Podospora didyma]
MALRIRYGDGLLRLARHGRLASFQLPRTHLEASTAAVVHCRSRLQTFSTSPFRRQDSKRQPPPPPIPLPRPPQASGGTSHSVEDVQILPPAGGAAEGSSSSPPPPKPKSRPVRRFIFAAAFLLFGTIGGSSLRLLVSPPEPPQPGSESDKYMTEILHQQAEALPVFKSLGADPAWESWDAYHTLSPQHRAQHIAAGAMAGSSGVGGYQRIFYNKSTGELRSLIFFGASITGWPGVIHGGALATILDESCGRAAFKQWGGMSGMTANLKLSYVKATLANGFYLIRVKPRAEEDLPESDRGKRHYKSFVDATIEDAVTGKVTVIAEALFIGGRGRDNKSDGTWGGTTRDENARF